jgi:prenyltransferase beta subunit
VTWQLASFLILGAGLACGFLWYDRSEPSARVLALVAALAALAVVGRIAFAAIPNVKPTTDIVLFSGYALGAAPGFAVGAVATLVSNIFFTQGPWTPWQMAAWGSIGVFGAALARVTRGRELGRWQLALACGVAGAWFGVVLDTHHWTLGAERTLASWLTVAGTSFPYNLAHVLGNVAFCLLIGPAFVRALQRYRRRFEVRWAAPAPAATAVLLALTLVGSMVAAPAARADASDRAARYLLAAQSNDGGFGSARGRASSQEMTTWAALGLAGAGRNPADVRRGKRSITQYMRTHARAFREPQDLERAILVLAAAGESPRNFARRDFVRELLGMRQRNGSVQGVLNRTTFAVLALRAARESTGVRAMVRWILPQQHDDGGFGLEGTDTSDVDTTSGVLQALVAAGRGKHPAVRRAVGYLRRVQNADGGFGQMRLRASNAQSTAWAIQGLVAAGRDPEALRRGSRTPLGYLRSLQTSSGSVRYSRTSAQTPVWVTAQAVLAFERAPFPLRRVRRERVRPAARAGKARREHGAKPSARAATTTAESEATPHPRRAAPASVPSRPVSAAAPNGSNQGDDQPDPVVVAASLAALALVSGGSWFWWRRRLARRRTA